MAWAGTSASGISGEMIRDMMLDCVERRFNALRAPQPVQWLADNGSPYTAGETIDFATALNLIPVLHARPQPREQRRLRGLREDLERPSSATTSA